MTHYRNKLKTGNLLTILYFFFKHLQKSENFQERISRSLYRNCPFEHNLFEKKLDHNLFQKKA
jgi:hypothetical protein